MRAYLSYKYGVDITAVVNLLHNNNIEIFDSISSDILYGNSFQQSIKNAVKSCDFLIFIYTENSAYIAFEAGIAVASNKPIFSILAGGEDNSFLYESTYVHALPTEADKIKYSFDLFFKNLTKKVGRSLAIKSSIQLYGGGEAMPMKDHFDINELYNSISDKSGIGLELFFQQVFQAYHVNIVKHSDFQLQNEKWVPDFSIWNDDLTPLFGNPIIVEVKSEINNSNLEQLLSNLDRLNSSNPINSVLIFYDRLRGMQSNDLPQSSNRLFISIPDFVNQLQVNGFASAIKKIRNNIAHQV